MLKNYDRLGKDLQLHGVACLDWQVFQEAL
jgi:hypothetical protein